MIITVTPEGFSIKDLNKGILIWSETSISKKDNFTEAERINLALHQLQKHMKLRLSGHLGIIPPNPTGITISPLRGNYEVPAQLSKLLQQVGLYVINGG